MSKNSASLPYIKCDFSQVALDFSVDVWPVWMKLECSQSGASTYNWEKYVIDNDVFFKVQRT